MSFLRRDIARRRVHRCNIPAIQTDLPRGRRLQPGNDPRRKKRVTMKIGYIRVSRDKQTTALQEDAMRQEQCERVFTDKMSGKRFDRPEFLRMLDVARAGDMIVVWRLDRLGRSLKQLIETLAREAQDLQPKLSTVDIFRIATDPAQVSRALG